MAGATPRARLAVEGAVPDPLLLGDAEVVVSPRGPGALDAGLLVEEQGDRFMVPIFREGEGAPTT